MFRDEITFSSGSNGNLKRFVVHLHETYSSGYTHTHHLSKQELEAEFFQEIVNVCHVQAAFSKALIDKGSWLISMYVPRSAISADFIQLELHLDRLFHPLSHLR